MPFPLRFPYLFLCGSFKLGMQRTPSSSSDVLVVLDVVDTDAVVVDASQDLMVSSYGKPDVRASNFKLNFDVGISAYLIW